MLILERSVTKPFWMRIYKILARKIKKGQFHEVQGTGVLQVQCDSGVRGYVMVERYFNELRPVAWLYLWQDQDWQAWEVMQVFVFEKLRGQGLAKKLYKVAINHDNIIMASGLTQSSSSRALWKSFIQKNTFDVYAIDYWNMKDRSQVFWDKDNDEIWCTLDIYYTGKPELQDRDVRLIATRK